MNWQRLNRPDALAVSTSDLDVHLRLSGEAELLSHAIRIALAAGRETEDHAEIALITQTVRVQFPGPNVGGSVYRLPVGPVLDGASITASALELDGNLTALTSAQFELTTGPRASLALLPDTGLPNTLRDCSTSLLVDYEAGYGADATSVPSDLAQAVLDQTAIMFDEIGGGELRRGHTGLSPHAARIAARHRGVRVA